MADYGDCTHHIECESKVCGAIHQLHGSNKCRPQAGWADYQACGLSIDCVSGICGDRAFLCRPRHGFRAGIASNHHHDCETGTFVQDGTCTRKVSDGQQCRMVYDPGKGSIECRSGFCFSDGRHGGKGICADDFGKLQIGWRCFWPKQCSTGICSSNSHGHCMQIVSAGGSCSDINDAFGSSTQCSSKFCLSPGICARNDGILDEGWQCYHHHHCKTGKCKNGRCAPKAGPGESCDHLTIGKTSKECSSGYCLNNGNWGGICAYDNGKLANGWKCFNFWECESNKCSGTCQYPPPRLWSGDCCLLLLGEHPGHCTLCPGGNKFVWATECSTSRKCT